uniref:Helix-loop-helix DNA-binding domain n=1 Tax=Schistocephalus solidus TaxID=70667 RepID=A0A0V0J419_SCHSO
MHPNNSVDIFQLERQPWRYAIATASESISWNYSPVEFTGFPSDKSPGWAESCIHSPDGGPKSLPYQPFTFDRPVKYLNEQLPQKPLRIYSSDHAVDPHPLSSLTSVPIVSKNKFDCQSTSQLNTAKNEREQQRVKRVNAAFALLRRHLPSPAPKSRSRRRKRGRKPLMFGESEKNEQVLRISTLPPPSMENISTVQNLRRRRNTKVNTLRMAIAYIEQLTQLLEVPMVSAGQGFRR